MRPRYTRRVSTTGGQTLSAEMPRRLRSDPMKPPRFDYLAPRTLDEALAHLHHHGDQAKILAGGQSLIPMLNFRLAHPAVVVDVNRPPRLRASARRRSGRRRSHAAARRRAL